MRAYIIGIAGEINSGKDTVASMINYIFSQGTTKAKYHDWVVSKTRVDLTFKDRVISFADPMKDCLSIIYNIPREYFNDRDKKDNEWYSLDGRVFLSNKDAESHNYCRITLNDLENSTLDEVSSRCRLSFKQIPIIRLRTLMQYFGTNLCRYHLDSKVWVTSIMGKAVDIAQARRLCLIPDVRYYDENSAILSNSLYGQVIKINRENSNKINHDSENIDFECPYSIDNNGTKMQLFYKVLTIVQQIIYNSKK